MNNLQLTHARLFFSSPSGILQFLNSGYSDSDNFHRASSFSYNPDHPDSDNPYRESSKSLNPFKIVVQTTPSGTIGHNRFTQRSNYESLTTYPCPIKISFPSGITLHPPNVRVRLSNPLTFARDVFVLKQIEYNRA